METKNKTLIDGEWTTPEFEYLANNKWMFTEKVDGTNIRVMLRSGAVTFGGRTDAAHIPAQLATRLNETFLPRADKMAEIFRCDACLYGEGYGAKIQKGGGNYRPDQDFVLFDVRIGEWWLQRADVEDAAEKLGIGVVPVIGDGTLYDAIALVRDGFESAWGNFEAEGIVARPQVELKTRSGHRIITKIKCRDFRVKDCSCGQAKEVKECHLTDCPLWPLEIERLRKELEKAKTIHTQAAVEADADAAWLREQINTVGDCWQDENGNCLRLSGFAETLEKARDTMVSMANKIDDLKEDAMELVQGVMAMCGNPDASDACRLILRECNDWLFIHKHNKRLEVPTRR
jgi:hypothetical protein